MKKLFAIALSAVLLSQYAYAAENLAPKAVEITASTYFSDDYLPTNVADGIVRGEAQRLRAWVTDYESEADLTINFGKDVTVTKAVLYDLPSTSDNVASGSLTFSDGTVVEFGELDKEGNPTEVVFDAPITANSVVVHVVSDDDTMSVGLDEIEIFDADGVNVALNAEASASSVQPDGDTLSWDMPPTAVDWYAAFRAVNGSATATLPEGVENEWASQAEANPTITLAWTAPITVGTIVLYDRGGSSDNIMGGEIVFSDGTTIEFDGMPGGAEPFYIDVADITTDTITINCTNTEGPNPGFAEIEVFTEHYKDGAFEGEEVAAETEAAAAETVEAEVVAETETAAAETVAATEAAAETEAPQTSDFAFPAFIGAAVAALAAFVAKKRNFNK